MAQNTPQEMEEFSRLSLFPPLADEERKKIVSFCSVRYYT